jgi:TolB-like protein
LILLYLFEDFTLDTSQRELRREGSTIPLQPQVFDLLEYLIRHRDRVATKDDLITAIWGGRIVSESSLTTRINAARTAIGDSGEKQRLIKTAPRKGVRFVGTVHEEGHAAGETIQVSPQPARRLSIVVLPFANLSGDPEQDYFADGVTESLTTDLSRISGSFVIARNTAFTFKGKGVGAERLGRELNVRYVLEGSVQRGGNRLRVNVQLIDAETGNHLWAERFDKPIADLFDMQDEIVARLANTLNAQLIEAEARRAERSHNPDAMDLYFQGTSWWNKGMTPEYMAQAKTFFERALMLDPGQVESLVAIAAVDSSVGANFMVDDRDALFAAAEATVTKALSMSPRHARGHLVLGSVLNVTKRAAQGIRECELSLALDQNSADAHGLIGLAKVFLGRGAETEAHIQEAFRLSPRDIFAFRWLHYVGMARQTLGDDAGAAAWLRRSLEANRNYPLAHFQLAASLALLGSLEEARAAVQAGLALNPAFTLRRSRGRMSDDPTYRAGAKRIYEGMQIAGVPEN